MMKSNFAKALTVKGKKPKKIKMKKVNFSKIQSGQGPFKSKKKIASY